MHSFGFTPKSTTTAVCTPGGEVFVPDGCLDLESVGELFTRVAEKHYTPYKGLLTCGHLKCNITLHPAPEPANRFSSQASLIS